MTDLANLNTFRAFNGKAPLKAWKASKQALADAYNKEVLAHQAKEFEATVEEIAQQIVRPHPDAFSSEGIREIVPVEAPATKLVKGDLQPKALKSVKLTPPAGDIEPFDLVHVARQLGIDPKLARVKARRHLTSLRIHPDDGWTFKASDYDAVVAILKNDARKKGA